MVAANEFKNRIAFDLIKGNHYIITKDGSVKNTKGKTLGTTNNKGYVMVHFKHKGKIYLIQAHRLVWMKFKGRIPVGLVPNHKNGIKTENRLSNLELVTESGNIKHAYSTGLNDSRKVSGSKNHQAKLTEQKVIEARYLKYQCKWTYKALCAKFGVSKPTMYYALIGKFWDHVTEGLPRKRFAFFLAKSI